MDKVEDFCHWNLLQHLDVQPHVVFRWASWSKVVAVAVGGGPIAWQRFQAKISVVAHEYLHWDVILIEFSRVEEGDHLPQAAGKRRKYRFWVLGLANKCGTVHNVQTCPWAV
jgi:hypothetical protein